MVKLDHHGVRGDLNHWIDAFLKDRKQRVLVEGAMSQAADVLSGVPQGTCLGPILFLIYINDITYGIDSQLSLLADDALLYRPINSFDDHLKLQEDLEKMQKWAEAWDMRFNAKKCYVLSAKRSGTRSTFRYTLCGQVLKTVPTNPYLGVELSSDLTFKAHIQKICAKSSRTLGFLCRNLRGCPQELRELAYNSMCRSTLEYASQIWDPYLVEEIKKIEKIQRRAARFVKQDFRQKSSVTKMMQDLKWESLESRRRQSRLALLYQIINQEIAVPFEDNPHLQPGCRGKFVHQDHKYRAFKESFYPRTIRDWNKLPESTKDSPSLATFKDRLKQHCC